MSDSLLPRRAWLVVGLLWVVGCLNYIDRVMLITMRQSVQAAIPMTEAQFGLLSTVFLIVYAMLSPVGGFIADRLSCSRTIIFSLFAWSAITWMTAHATSFNELLMWRALMGISEACYLPAAAALIARYHGPATRSLANGIHLSGVMVGSGLGGLGGLIAEHHPWTTAFEIFGVVGVLYSIVLLAFLRDNPQAATPGVDPATGSIRVGEMIRSLFESKKFLIALAFWGMLGITSWSFSGWMPAFLIEQFHLPQGKAGLMATGFQSLGSLSGMIIAGAWADRWSRRNPEGRAIVGIIGLGICIPCVFLVSNSPYLPLTLAGLVCFGLTRAFPDANMMPILFEITDKRYRATAYGILNAFATTAGGLVIYLGGLLRDAHVSVTTVFYIGTVGMALCSGLLWVIRPHQQAVS
ncbi:MAG: MFS transporter [Verrucomicrobia bacterium]|nr:MFS transporter [Verrucomicrobiota bacterium]